MQARINEITTTLEKSIIIDEDGRESEMVKVGAVVVVKDLSNGVEQKPYTLVNKAEANPLARRISDDSPMGRELLDKRVGDTLEVKTPRGEQKYEVVSIA